MMEEIAPHRLAERWDNPGLQIGSLNQVIKSIYFSLDPTVDSIKRAASKKVDLLVTHHPLIFRPISKLDIADYPAKVIKEAIENRISIVSFHTNLDSSKEGINAILAELLSLNRVSVLRELEEDVGLGRIGYLKNAMPLKDFLISLKEIFEIQKIRIVCKKEDLDKPIKKIAVVGGSGRDLIPDAIEKGADVMITGDIGYHDALNALFNGLILVDAGHFCLEKKAFNIFARQFSEKIIKNGFEVDIIIDKEEKDPFMIV